MNAGSPRPRGRTGRPCSRRTHCRTSSAGDGGALAAAEGARRRRAVEAAASLRRSVAGRGFRTRRWRGGGRRHRRDRLPQRLDLLRHGRQAHVVSSAFSRSTRTVSAIPLPAASGRRTPCGRRPSARRSWPVIAFSVSGKPAQQLLELLLLFLAACGSPPSAARALCWRRPPRGRRAQDHEPQRRILDGNAFVSIS